MHPRNGRLICEDGGPTNVGDYWRRENRYSPIRQIAENGASRLSAVRRGVDQDVYWIGLDVPDGRRLILWEDAVKLTENDYNLDVFRAPDGFTGGSAGVKSCLCGTGTDTVQSELYMDVTPTDELTHVHVYADLVDTGAIQGPGRPGATPLAEKTFQILIGPALIRITRQAGGTPFSIGYRAVAWEEDNE
jgi:hypothetical protein